MYIAVSFFDILTYIIFFFYLFMQFTTDGTDNDVSMYKAKCKIYVLSGHLSQKYTLRKYFGSTTFLLNQSDTARWRSDQFWYRHFVKLTIWNPGPGQTKVIKKFRGLCLHSTSVVILPNYHLGTQWIRRVQKRNFGSWISLVYVVLLNSQGFK